MIRFTLIFVLTTPLVWAYEFQHFQFHPQKANKSFSNMSPILLELAEYLSDKYQKIGNEQSRDLIENHDIGGGVYNFSGFSWYKPMLNYSIKADRDLAPDLYSDRWIVQDKFIIFVEAATLLTNLRDANVLSISDSELEAFAGISFSRVYTTFHYADSYLEGLTADYRHLFMSFLRYHPDRVFDLAPYQVSKRKDTFSFNAGGKVDAPIGHGFEVRAGVLVNIAYENEVSLQKVGPQDRPKPQESLRINIDQSLNKKVEGQISLQYDFFNLLNLTLLSHELEYSYGSSKKVYLSLLEQDEKIIARDSKAKEDLKLLLRGSNKPQFWLPRVVSLEDRMKESLRSKFSFLLLGKLKKRATEQITIIKEGIKKVFFKHYFESKKYVQGLLSRLFKDIVLKLFDFDMGVKNKAYKKKEFFLEFEKQEGLKPDHVDDFEKFSIKLASHFQVSATHKWYHRPFYRAALAEMRNWTFDSDEIYQQIKNRSLQGPIKISATFELGEDAFDYFHQFNDKQQIENILHNCRVKSKFHHHYFNSARRRLFFRTKLNRRNRCARTLTRSYLKYKDQFNSSEISLNKFRKHIDKMLRYAKDYRTIIGLFGADNVFIHGNINAKKSADGKKFVHFFKSGQFQGLGVIESFKQDTKVISINET